MGSIAHLVIEESRRIWELRDLRTDGFPLAHSPMTPVLLCLAYLFTVKVWGPKLMENREPFQLRGLIIVYNAFQIVFNGWLFFESYRVTWYKGYSIICQPVDYSENEDALRIVFLGYCLYISKFVDFLDTLFFVLRKKENQITFLHVFHHSLTPITVWLCIRFVPGGQACFYMSCNTFVHFAMYFYYMMAAMGPSIQKYLWWKKYITILQMVQFVLVGLHSAQLLFIECDYPKAYAWCTTMQAVMYFFLFKNFHKGTYNRSQSKISVPIKAGSAIIMKKKHL